MEKKTLTEQICELVGRTGGWFFTALLIWWGWNILAPHINCPLFGYWEIFAMRMMLSSITKIIFPPIIINKQDFNKREEKENG